MMTYREFGHHLTEARNARGLSRVELACHISVDPSFYARVERGHRMVSLITFALIWRRLAIDAAPVLATLPIEVAEPNKRQRQRKEDSKSLAEFTALVYDFDRMMARARNKAGLTQQELANAVALSRRHIARIETGYGLPSLTAFARMHRVLGFDANRALASLLGHDVPPKSPYLFGDAERAFWSRSVASSRLWPGGPYLSVLLRNEWRCQCHELRTMVPALMGTDEDKLPRLCIGLTPVDIRLQRAPMVLPLILLGWDTGDEIEIRQPGFDGSLGAAPSAFMAALFGLIVAKFGLDMARLRSIQSVVRYVDRQCVALIRSRELITLHE